ncbi:MAG TPA: hypothetical protein VE779_08505 [Candidatus Angelobacter sp.]|nr:hypothetical protein [Candidatus Angelobacter sp.]
MTFAIHQFKLAQADRRFVVWMAIGTVFILALGAVDFFGLVPIP